MAKSYPKVKLLLDKNFDKKIFEIGGRAERGLRPEIRFLLKPEFADSRQKFLDAYVDSWQERNKKDLALEIKRVQTEWSGLSKYFFAQVDKMFYGRPWPKGDYVGYGSMWFSFPRHIKDKKFAFPLFFNNKKRLASSVIAHEMLHFIQYDYLEKKHGLPPSDKTNSLFWQFTENLNVLIENSQAWQPFMQGEISKPYEGNEELYKKMKRIWDKNQDLDNLINKILK